MDWAVPTMLLDPICCADIELLTDRQQLEMVEKMIRGAVASVFDEKFKANN